MKLIFETKFGSHLYGTNTENSDTDFKGVYIPSAKDILLQRVKGAISKSRHKEQEGIKNSSEDIDKEYYSLQEYLNLLSQGQTVAIDMLFAPEPILSSELWGNIRLNRDKLLTKKSASFLGYCKKQASKYGIKGSRVSSVQKAMEFFKKSMDVSSTAKVEHVDYMLSSLEDEHTRIYTKETTAGKFETYFECCNRSVGFKNTVKEAYTIYNRIYEEYGKRARAAQENEGIDWKALSHAVRVGTEALELLRTGSITFPCPNAAHLLEIKQGKLAYQPVAEEIEKLLVDVEEASKTSKLLDEPDQKFIDELVYIVYGAEVNWAHDWEQYNYLKGEW